MRTTGKADDSRAHAVPGTTILDAPLEEVGELPESDAYIRIEVIQPGDRTGHKAIISLDRFNRLASTGDMSTTLMNAVAAQSGPSATAEPKRRTRRGGGGGASAEARSTTPAWSTAANLTGAGSRRPTRSWSATTWTR